MSLPPEPSPEAIPPAGPPVGPPVITIDLSRLPSTLTALGISLVGAAIVLSATFSREGDDLDLSNFTMGALAAAGLLVVAVIARLFVPDADGRTALVSWPGAVGAAGTGVMLGVLITNDDAAVYTASLAVIALSVAGYLLTRAAPFVITTIGGLALLYGQVFEDAIDVDGDGGNAFMIVGAAIAVFVIVTTAAGWLLPQTRVLSSTIVGVGGLAALAATLQTLVFTRLLSVGFSEEMAEEYEGEYEGEFEGDFEGEMPEDFEAPAAIEVDDPFVGMNDSFENDIYVILAIGLLLTLLWMCCSLATGHIAFRLLVLAAPVVLIPLGAMALYIRHATWWELACAGIGGLLLVGVGLRSLKAPTGSATG